MKRSISFILTLIMVFGILTSVPVTVSAASLSDLTFDLNEDGASYYVEDCVNSASGKLVIPATYNGLPVTRIWALAFSGCKNLTSVEIPDSVVEIGSNAFYKCAGLTSVEIPDSVKDIGSGAFAGCTNLKSIKIPDSVTSIGYDAFKRTAYYNNSANWENEVLYIGKHLIDAKTSISGKYSIKSGTKTIAGDAFDYCKSLTSITIPDSVVSIGNGAFSYTNLTSIVIPDSVTSIESRAFNGCEKLTSIEIPGSVSSVGFCAFEDCTGLKTVSLGKGVECISEEAFSGCSSLKSIEIPDSVTSIESDAFEECESLTSVYITDIRAWCNINFAAYSSPLEHADKLYLNGELVTDVVIPDGVTKIPEYAFSCTSLKSIKIPGTVTRIDDFAFNGCTNLTTIEMPDSVTSVGSGVFYNSGYYNNAENWTDKVLYVGNHLIDTKTSISGKCLIKNGTKTIADNAFYECKKLTSVEMPDSLISIGEDAFYNCTSLITVTIGDSVTSIGDFAFSNCTSLTSIEIPDSVTSIGDFAFYYCESLTSIELPDSVTSIGGCAFYDCTSLTSIEIPDSVTSIGSSAFKGCTSLTSIEIPDSVKSIDTDAFKYCDGLKSVYITDIAAWLNIDFEESYNEEWEDDGNDGYNIYEWKSYESNPLHCAEYLYLNGERLTSIEIPAGIQEIKAGAFYGYKKLKSVKIPTAVTAIGSDAFTECNSLNIHYAGSKDEWNKISGSSSVEAGICFNGNTTALSAPKISKVENTASGVKVTWAKVSGAESYEVYVTTEDRVEKKLATTDKTSYTHKTAKNASAYTYSVRAVGKNAVSRYSNNSKQIIRFTVPKLGSKGHTADGIKINWGKVAGVEGYIIYRKTSSTGWTEIGRTKTTNYTDKTAKGGTTYFYTVRGYKDNSKSWYDEGGLKIKCLSVPKLGSKGNVAEGTIINWGKVTGASGYYVYRKTKGGKWAEIGKTTKTAYVDKTAKAGTTYYYTVRAYSGTVKSWYNEDGLKLIRLAPSKLSTPKSTKSGITLKWSKVAGAEGYVVFRKTGNGDYVKLKTEKGISNLSYTDKSAKKGKKYTYVIKAYSGKTYAANSNAKTITDKY